MDFEPCQKCVIEDTCTLNKNGNQVKCELNKDKEIPVEYVHHIYQRRFKKENTDDDVDYTKYEGYCEDD